MSSYGIFGILNESVGNLLMEAQQVVIDFKNAFGADAYDNFRKAKQHLVPPENDISYWVGKYKREGERVIPELLSAIGSAVEIKYDIEGKTIPAPAESKSLVAENEFYAVYDVDDYTDMIDLAMRKIDGFAGGYWCIAGRYNLPSSDGVDKDDAVKVSQAEHFFTSYLDSDYDAYLVCIPKNSGHDKYCICLRKDGSWDVWDTRDSRSVDSDFEDVPHFVFGGHEFLGAESVERESDGYDEDELADEGPEEWEDEEGVVHNGVRPNDPQDPEFILVANPTELEYHVGSKEEAIKAFAKSGEVEGVEFVEDIPNTPICIVKFMVEPTHEEFPQEGNDVYVRDLPGDRYTPFIFIPGDGGGPLLTQDGKLVAHRTAEGAKEQFVREFHQDQVYRQGEEPRRPEPEANESLKKKGYFCYEEGCKLKEGENEKDRFVIIVGEEPIKDVDENTIVFESQWAADGYAMDELDLMVGDYSVERI